MPTVDGLITPLVANEKTVRSQDVNASAIADGTIVTVQGSGLAQSDAATRAGAVATDLQALTGTNRLRRNALRQIESTQTAGLTIDNDNRDTHNQSMITFNSPSALNLTLDLGLTGLDFIDIVNIGVGTLTVRGGSAAVTINGVASLDFVTRASSRIAFTGAADTYHTIFDSRVTPATMQQVVPGSTLELLVNNSGSTIPAGSPVVAVTSPAGVRQMEHASTVSLGTDVTSLTSRTTGIYGFVTEDVLDDGTNTPIRSGIIDNVRLVATNNSIGQSLIIRSNLGNYEISDVTFSDANGDYAEWGGEVTGDGTSLVADQYLVYVNIDLMHESRIERYLLASSPVPSNNVTSSGSPSVDQWPQFSADDVLIGLDRIPPNAVGLPRIDETFFGTLAINSQSQYAAYVEKSIVWTSSNAGTRIFELPLLRPRDSYVIAGDVFEIENSIGSVGNVLVTIRAGDDQNTIGGGSITEVTLIPGSYLKITAPVANSRNWVVLRNEARASAGSGATGQVGTGNTGSVSSPSVFANNIAWPFGADGVVRRAGDAEINQENRLSNENVRDHIVGSVGTNNPYSTTFDDDQSMITWWHSVTAEPTLDLGSNIGGLLDKQAPAIAWLTSNVNVGYDFQFVDPDGDLTITAITPQGGGVVRLLLDAAVANTTWVGHDITVSGAGVSTNNGTFAITATGALHIDISNASGITEGSISVSGKVQVYADVLVTNPVTRVFNFRLYKNAARNVDATLLATAFDPSVATGTALSVDYIGVGLYRSKLTIEGDMFTKDPDGTLHQVNHGPRQGVTFIDNGIPTNSGLPDEPEFSNPRVLPINSPIMVIRTQKIAIFQIPVEGLQLAIGESRKYKIFSHPNNERGGVQVTVSDGIGGIENLDGDLVGVEVLPGKFVEVLSYNDGNGPASKLITPVLKTMPSQHLSITPTIITSTALTLPVTQTVIDAPNNEDPGFLFFSPFSNNQIRVLSAGKHEFKRQVNVEFAGAEPTGILFVPVVLMPIINGVDAPEFADRGSIFFLRNGQTGASAPINGQSLYTDFVYNAADNDTIEWELRSGPFPASFGPTDLQYRDDRFKATVMRGLN